MTIHDRLAELGILLPLAPAPAGPYVPAAQTGRLLFVSGQLPVFEGKVAFVGKVGREIKLEQAREAARLCAVNALAVVQEHLGSLDDVRQIVRVDVFVNAADGFIDLVGVANGASDLLHKVFGDPGRHARVTVGVAELPRNAAVELALIVETKRPPPRTV